jgi:hypothetical protein
MLAALQHLSLHLFQHKGSPYSEQNHALAAWSPAAQTPAVKAAMAASVMQRDKSVMPRNKDTPQAKHDMLGMIHNLFDWLEEVNDWLQK